MIKPFELPELERCKVGCLWGGFATKQPAAIAAGCHRRCAETGVSGICLRWPIKLISAQIHNSVHDHSCAYRD